MHGFTSHASSLNRLRIVPGSLCSEDKTEGTTKTARKTGVCLGYEYQPRRLPPLKSTLSWLYETAVPYNSSILKIMEEQHTGAQGAPYSGVTGQKQLSGRSFGVALKEKCKVEAAKAAGRSV